MNKQRRYSIISKRGVPLVILGASIVAFLVLTSYWLYSLPVLAITLLLAFLYRDLPRTLPSKPLAILSPLDGDILRCESGYDPYVERECLCVEVQTHALGPFVLRSPTEGKVMQQWFSPAGRDMEGNKQGQIMAIWIRTDEEDDVVVVVSPKYHWLRMSCHVQAGERVGQGRRCGFIPLGAKIEVFLPVDARLQVEQGMRVTAGDTILAELVHR